MDMNAGFGPQSAAAAETVLAGLVRAAQNRVQVAMAPRNLAEVVETSRALVVPQDLLTLPIQ